MHIAPWCYPCARSKPGWSMSWRNALQNEKHTHDADTPFNIILSSENTPKLSPTFMCTFQAGDHVNVENYEGGIKILHRSRSMIGMSWKISPMPFYSRSRIGEMGALSWFPKIIWSNPRIPFEVQLLEDLLLQNYEIWESHRKRST